MARLCTMGPARKGGQLAAGAHLSCSAWAFGWPAADPFTSTAYQPSTAASSGHSDTKLQGSLGGRRKISQQLLVRGMVTQQDHDCLHLLSQADELAIVSVVAGSRPLGWEVPAFIPACLTALSPVVTTLTTAVRASQTPCGDHAGHNKLLCPR